MNATSPPPNDHRPWPDRDAQTAEQRQAELFAALLQTRELGRTVCNTVLAMLRNWAGDNRVKGIFSAILSWLVRLVFAPSFSRRAASVPAVLGEPMHARTAAAALPALGNGIIRAGQVLQKTAHGSDDAAGNADGRTSLDWGAAAELLSDCLREKNEKAGTDDEAAGRRQAVADVIARLDFGEIKEASDRLAAGAEDVAAMVNEELWRYPAKTICLAGVLPSGVNAAVRGLVKTLEPINQMAPDLIADVLLTLLREIDGEAVGRLVNEGLELLRKVETGQILIGELGKPQLPEDAGRLLEGVLDVIDFELLLKLKGLLGETREAVSLRLCSYMENHPELVKDMLAAPCRDKAAAVKQAVLRLDTIENTLDDGEIAGTIQQAMSALDAQETAEAVNRSLSLFNRVHDEHPGVVRDLFKQIAQSLDEYEAEQALDKLAEDAAAALKPLAPVLLPPVLQALADMLAESERRSGKTGEALENLRMALLPDKEVA